MTALSDKVRQILSERNISIHHFSRRTGIGRIFFYQGKWRKHHKWTVETVAEYLGIPAGELVKGTHMEKEWEDT